MGLETSTTRMLRFRLAPLVALVFSIALTFGNVSKGQAQDGVEAEAPTASTAGEQPDQRAATDPEEKANADAAQQAHDAADAAEEALDNATQARDQLESDGASQDQIDAANQAIAQARANKDAADAAAQSADDAMGQ